MAAGSTYQRLSVNLNEESAEILRRVTKDRGISTTEAVRRAIGLLDFFERTHAEGTKIWTETHQGDRAQLHML